MEGHVVEGGDSENDAGVACYIPVRTRKSFLCSGERHTDLIGDECEYVLVFLLLQGRPAASC